MRRLAGDGARAGEWLTARATILVAAGLRYPCPGTVGDRPERKTPRSSSEAAGRFESVSYSFGLFLLPFGLPPLLPFSALDLALRLEVIEPSIAAADGIGMLRP